MARMLAPALALAACCAHAAPGDLVQRQSEAQRQQSALRDRIQSLQKTIEQRDAARQEAADGLRQSETAISETNRRLAELDAQHRRAQAELTALEGQLSDQQEVLTRRRAELAGQLKAQYASGLSPWTALLSGDDPQALGRNLAYLGYVSRARTQAVQALRADIERLGRLQTQADERRAEIAKVLEQTAQGKAQLVAQRKERALVLARLEGQINAQREEATKLGRDDQRMSRLIGDIQVALEQQAEQARREEAARREAEAARRAAEAEAVRQAQERRRLAQEEARRKTEEARLRAEAARQAAQAAQRAREANEAQQAREQVEAAARRDAAAAAEAARQAAEAQAAAQVAARQAAAQARPAALADIDGLMPVEPPVSARGARAGTDADAGPDAETERGTPARRPQTADTAAAPAPGAPREPTARPPAQRAVSGPSGAGRGLQRGLPMPVKGTVQGRFGVSRPDGGTWRGIVLRADEGTPVHAVAPGAVVYASWLRGFGNLIIVDHGKQYMTVYAYNQSLLKQVGDNVAAGDAIATVGATGGQVESGLYFEIRHGGAPVDPAQWLAQ